MAKEMENRIYYGNALPIAWPNMGPEIYSAWWVVDMNLARLPLGVNHVLPIGKLMRIKQYLIQNIHYLKLTVDLPMHY